MKKLLISSLVLLAFEARSAFGGLDLTWRACNTAQGSSSTAVLDCASPRRATIDLFGCFQVPVSQDSFIAMDGALDLRVEDPNGPPLEDFWHFESGACNDLAIGSVVMSIARPDDLGPHQCGR